MVQKYVWWDDIEKHKRSRVDLRMPKPLADFIRSVAKEHGVSVNSLIVGIVAYAADAESRRRLRIEVVPDVRVTEAKPEGETVDIPARAVSPATRKRYQIPKVL